FDIVLFMGVLYHLKHPLLALERVCAVTKEMVAVDSFVLREEHRPGEQVERRPVMEFYETSEFGGQTDNWVGPSLECLLAFCRTAGFARAEVTAVLPHSACVACYRKWAPPLTDSEEAPKLIDALHHTNFGINFYSRRDEYVTCWFDWPAAELGLDDVKPEVDGYGVRPIRVLRADQQWQAQFRLPPGLDAGWREVRLRVGESGVSNAVAIAVDMPLGEPRLKIRGVSDGTTWKRDEIDFRHGDHLSLWIAGLPANADRNNLRVSVGGEAAEVVWVERSGSGRERQVNVLAP